jgi:hypothetical protein
MSCSVLANLSDAYITHVLNTLQGAATKASLEAATSSNTALHSELSTVQSELATVASAAEASAEAAADKEAQFEEKVLHLKICLVVTAVNCLLPKM